MGRAVRLTSTLNRNAGTYWLTKPLVLLSRGIDPEAIAESPSRRVAESVGLMSLPD
jgi:hypothetical protein